MEGIIKKYDIPISHFIKSRNFRGTSTNEKIVRISGLNDNKTIPKKNVSIIVHFCLGKYNFSHDNFRTQHVKLFQNFKKEI